MKFIYLIHSKIRISSILIIPSLIILLAFVACSTAPKTLSPLEETQLELSVQQTLAAQQASLGANATVEALNATLTAQTVQLTRQALPDAPTVDVSSFTNATEGAIQATQAAEETAAVIAQTPSTVDLMTFMKQANILLYEDMINDTNTNRYIKDTLDRMELPYKDDGSAKGWFKDDLTSGAPNGKPWDLVILAAEAKSGVQGEFFTYVEQALDQGASVIMEVWYLDQVYAGAAASLLARCGVAFERDWSGVPPQRMVMFPISPGHPILNQPNSGVTFTDVTSFWWDPSGKVIYDIGDWMKISGTGDAVTVVGTLPTEQFTHGTITVCLGGRLILQTFSSHQLTFKAMYPVWENYIYNALKVKWEGSP